MTKGKGGTKLGYRTCQDLRMEDLMLVSLVDLKNLQRDDRNDLAIQGRKFYLVTFAPW
ncbi:hypothetical protein ACTRXD_22290 [Nitrospira sp. T9]|uniref:hypothetical protein n=1 Tax=unclassified Nitrospira TaxID=2652172 RepID=UPI003F96295A